MKILMVGDIVGSPGRRIFKEQIPRLIRSGDVHAVIANGENAAAGNGITGPLADELIAAGASIVTLGDHIWGQKSFDTQIGANKKIVRPANLPPGVPGETVGIAQTALGPFAVVSILGRTFMNPCDCPFRAMDEILRKIPGGIPVFVDFHAEATSEKIAMGHYLDGRVAAVAGTHTHVQTSDALILPGGTAYISDLGMTGPYRSVIGREIAPVIRRFTTGMPGRFDVAEGPCVLEGALIDIDRGARFPNAITPFRIREPLA